MTLTAFIAVATLLTGLEERLAILYEALALEPP